MGPLSPDTANGILQLRQRSNLRFADPFARVDIAGEDAQHGSMPRRNAHETDYDQAPAASTSAVVEVAKRLRSEILRRSDDDLFLGSEDDLLRRLKVSQPTFRQAARLLEYEELLTVRRGIGGGFFARRPSARAVAQMAGIYLHAQGADFKDVMATGHLLETEIIRRLVANPDAAVRGRLLTHLRGFKSLNNPADPSEILRAINNVWRFAGDLSGSKSLGLFTHAAQAYASRIARLPFGPRRIAAYVARLEDMAVAIRDGNADRALEIRWAMNQQMLDWVQEADDAEADETKF